MWPYLFKSNHSIHKIGHNTLQAGGIISHSEVMWTELQLSISLSVLPHKHALSVFNSSPVFTLCFQIYYAKYFIQLQWFAPLVQLFIFFKESNMKSGELCFLFSFSFFRLGSPVLFTCNNSDISDEWMMFCSCMSSIRGCCWILLIYIYLYLFVFPVFSPGTSKHFIWNHRKSDTTCERKTPPKTKQNAL